MTPILGRAYYITTLDQWKNINLSCESHWAPLDLLAPISKMEDWGTDKTPIVTVIFADEWTHLQLQQTPGWEALPHPLSGRPVKPELLAQFKNHPHPDLKAQEKAAQAKTPGPPLNTFQLICALAASHPLLGWSMF